jgi:glycosyltransferase involved in cell wall biosynthesis
MFSIIIPLYNKESSIAETLESVFEQEFTDFEVLIVNDGSTDKSLDVVKQFTDSRIQIFNKENGGVSDARNFGIKRAQRDFLAFLDADDGWNPMYLQKMKELIEKYPHAGMYSSAYKTMIKGKPHFLKTEMKEGYVNNFFLESISSHISWTSATVVRRSGIEKTGYFPVGMISGEDDYLWTKFAIHFPVVFTPEVLAIYNRADETLLARAGKVDRCKESWIDLLSEDDEDRNRFIFMKLLKKGIRYAWGNHLKESKKIEEQSAHLKVMPEFRYDWYKLFILNRLPKLIKKGIMRYKTMKSSGD